MRIEDSISFKSVHFSDTADRAMRNRLTAKDFRIVKSDLADKYAKSKLDIFIYTINENSDRLTADIKHGGRKFASFEESFFSKIFYTPLKFIDNVIEKADSLERRLFGVYD